MPSDTPPRWRRRKEARRPEILDAALDLFAERGYAATRLDDVAGRAGVVKGTLYLYFPNKEELFKAVVREALVPNLAAVERMVAGSDGPAGDVLARLVTHLAERVATTRLGIIPKLVVAEAANFPELARFYLDEVVKRGFGVMAQVIERGVARGEFRPVPVEHAVRTLIAPVLMIALWKSAFEPVDDRPLDVAAFLAVHLDLVRRGLAADGDTP